jgi:hypothetical protein
MASLVGIATNPRAILAAHASLQLMYRGRLRPANDVERDGRVCVAAEAADFEVAITGINCLPKVGEGCAGPLKANILLFQASTDNRSASLRASRARSAAARTEAP